MPAPPRRWRGNTAEIAADGIDLTGYCEGGRPEIPALRPAPVQATHLGYPGPLGAPWIDYVIADPVVLPAEAQPHWRERIVHLPHCYQPNDRARPSPPPDTDRAAHGLPEQGLVFACFNNPYKITPEIFATWMSLLRAVPESVLWLYEENALVAESLRGEARRHGLDPARLRFAPPADRIAHLARHGCADLFLDTSPYGAHTTGSDALWCGLPLVTLRGRGFASRVATSLSHAVGLPELSAGSLAEYEALALRLARDPAERARQRTHQLAARETAPLFDAPGFTRALEAAYDRMVAMGRAGESPRGFAITAE